MPQHHPQASSPFFTHYPYHPNTSAATGSKDANSLAVGYLLSHSFEQQYGHCVILLHGCLWVLLLLLCLVSFSSSCCSVGLHRRGATS